MVELENNDYNMYYDVSDKDKFNLPTKLELKEDLPNITLTWENVNIHMPKHTKGIFKKVTIPSKKIIQNVEGVARPGELLAIMGASGAGKTTLLNVLTFRSNGNLKGNGDVKVNGKLIKSSEELASISGYVQQDDIFIGTLKVKEHLKFQAMLRMNPKATKEERNERVEEVLQALNLEKCKETLIGDFKLRIKGISGGERRRLAFASEIITNPPLLFCDEPTSGLDSFMAMTIVESMKSLALQGKTIICTIHQPSSEIFQNFDNLYLMAEGRLAYSGALTSASDFFFNLGHKCPENYNPADFYINKLAISPFDRENSLNTVKEICDGFSKSAYAQELKQKIVSSNTEGMDIYPQSTSAYKTNIFTQFRWLFWRDTLSSLRNPIETRITFIQTSVIALMFGLIYFQLDLDQLGIQNINGVLFLLLLNSSFSNLFPVLNSFLPLVTLLLRENKNGMYRVISFFLSRSLVDLPKLIIGPILFCTIVYWMADLNNDFDKFCVACGIVVLGAVTAVSLGLFIGAIAPNLNIALALAPSFLVPLMILGGLFVNLDSIPVYFIWLKYLSWIRYGNENLIINQWDNIGKIDCPANATRCIETGQQVITVMSADINDYDSNFIWIGCLIVGFRVLAFLALLIKSYRK